eukprot:gene15383-35411_t
MQITPSWRDVFPKMDLHDQYIGDGLPLCTALPKQAFLQKGAKWSYLGSNPLPKLLSDPPTFADIGTLRVMLATSSPLFAALCGGMNPSACNFQPEVLLPSTLTCDGVECEIDEPRVVGIATNN